jgi:hypothetical protein
LHGDQLGFDTVQLLQHRYVGEQALLQFLGLHPRPHVRERPHGLGERGLLARVRGAAARRAVRSYALCRLRPLNGCRLLLHGWLGFVRPLSVLNHGGSQLGLEVAAVAFVITGGPVGAPRLARGDCRRRLRRSRLG